MIALQITQLVEMLEFLRYEASLEERSAEYAEFCESMLTDAATAEIGPLASLGEADLEAFEKVLETVISGMGNRPLSFEKIDAGAFVSFQKKLLVRPKKRGPKFQPNFDDAFLRYLNGESASEIARDLEPEAYEEDSTATIQRYCNAFERRREKLAGE
jgi:hypothetical protein